jgi:ABC-type sugar transport system ATPase subunit
MIEVQNLKKYYGDIKAVDDISFSVDTGEVLGFLGPNGAGKSTTMNIITGYISSTSGTVTVDGSEILEEPKKTKQKIGYLPEIPPLYPDMTVRRYLEFMFELKKVKLPSSLRVIGEQAFSGCNSLDSVVIPRDVTVISLHAFSCCDSLKRIELPLTIASIEGWAFWWCSSLERITIPAGTKSIGTMAFARCEKLSSVSLPYGLMKIGDRAFNRCKSLKRVRIPDSVISVGVRAFDVNTEVVFANNATGRKLLSQRKSELEWIAQGLCPRCGGDLVDTAGVIEYGGPALKRCLKCGEVDPY